LADHADYTSTAAQRLFSLITEAGRCVDGCASTRPTMSFQAALTGHHQQAVALIDAAQGQTRHSTTSRLRALLAGRKLRACARAGDTAGCDRALNEAERRLDAAVAERSNPDWISLFDQCELVRPV